MWFTIYPSIPSNFDMKSSILRIVLLLYFINEDSYVSSKSRVKRYLVFNRGGNFKLVIGIGTPIKIGTKQSMAIGWNFQAQYNVPTNISELTQYPPDYPNSRRVSKRESPVSDRVIVYHALEEILNTEGFDGRECILRSICENAVDSFSHGQNGLYGELLHIVFTPTYGDGKADPDLDLIYLEAQRAGEYGVECESLYTNCNMDYGFLGLFSILENEIGYA